MRRPGGSGALLALVLLCAGPVAAQQPAPQAAPPSIRHTQHRDLACSSCHSSRLRHGEVIVRTAADCQRCHHQGPGRGDCARCHAIARMPRSQPEPRTFQLAASRTPATITMRFDHQRHGSVACTRCHGDELSRAPDQADCAACHEQHHGAQATCTGCHQAERVIQHHTRAAHGSCATASCHGSAAANLPDSREACLVCHAAQQSHMTGRVCTTCHRMR